MAPTASASQENGNSAVQINRIVTGLIIAALSFAAFTLFYCKTRKAICARLRNRLDSQTSPSLPRFTRQAGGSRPVCSVPTPRPSPSAKAQELKTSFEDRTRFNSFEALPIPPPPYHPSSLPGVHGRCAAYQIQSGIPQTPLTVAPAYSSDLVTIPPLYGIDWKYIEGGRVVGGEGDTRVSGLHSGA